MLSTKKGISPLIATVLTIGFVIVLAVLFWQFASEQVEEVMDKEAAQQAGQVVCAKDVSYAVPSCSFDGTSVFVTISNDGDVPITAARLRVSGQLDGQPQVQAPLVEDEVQPGQEKTLVKSIVLQDPVTTVEVMPVVIYGGNAITCPEQAITCTFM